MEAYRVVNYTEDETGKNNQNPIDPLVHVVSIPNYIPSKTGVILRSSFAGESRIQYLKKSNSDTEELYYKDTPLDEGDRKANLLYPSVTSVLVHPVDKGGIGNFVEGGDITHRNFGFTTKKFGATTTNPKFVRLKEGNTNINRAYLKLPVALFPHNNENADGLNVTTSAKSFVGFDFDSSTSNRAPSSTSESDAQPLDIVGFEDNHAFTLVFPTVEETGIITAVEQMETTRNDNNFYTLQGVRVENPSKDVYIKNGKKFIIK